MKSVWLRVYKNVSQKNWILYINENYDDCHHSKTTRTNIYTKSLKKFKRPIIHWDGVAVPTKEPRGLIGQTYLTIRKMREVVMKTAEPVLTKEVTDRLV